MKEDILILFMTHLRNLLYKRDNTHFETCTLQEHVDNYCSKLHKQNYPYIWLCLFSKTKYKSLEILLTLQKCYSYSELMYTITCQGMSAIKYYN